ncbi:MAG: aspartate aminotransferase family protein [Chloroflexi bacterium]|nr:aspartate aminotransferase family protein [Chloroflexota bacterium]
MSRLLDLFAQANQVLIGGAGASGRYYPLLGHPVYVARGEGARFWDVDGREYLDLFTGSGANFLGHAHPAIGQAIRDALEIGIICNGETEHHVRLAQMIAEAVPCAEKVRLQNSGTEATMGAIRIARAYTGRRKILKFEGHFHGMHDLIWFNCGAELGDVRTDGTVAPIADSAGTPADLGDLLAVVPFNDTDAFDRAINAHSSDLAAVIMEPISYNQGCVPADPAFLQHVRDVCSRMDIVLIFDEVLSGFRMCRGGAQEHYGITPDLCTLAKALGGGVPISAVCGRTDIMSVLSPLGPAIMSGTYTGHLTAVLGAIACQTELAKPGFYEHINALADHLYNGITYLLDALGVLGTVQGIGARFGLYLGVEGPVTNYREAMVCDRAMEAAFLMGCVRRGLYLHDYNHRTPMHHGFSAVHSLADIDEALGIMEDALREARDAQRTTTDSLPT